MLSPSIAAESYNEQGIFLPQPHSYNPATRTLRVGNEFVSSGCQIARVLLGGRLPAKPRLEQNKLYLVDRRPGNVERFSSQHLLDKYGRERRSVQDRFQVRGLSNYGGLYDTAVLWRSRTELRVTPNDPRRMRLDGLAITLSDDIQQVRPQVALRYESTPGKQAAYLQLDGQAVGGGQGALASTYNSGRMLSECEEWVPPMLHTMAASMQALAAISVSSLVLMPEQSAAPAAADDPYHQVDGVRERALIAVHRLLPEPYFGS